MIAKPSLPVLDRSHPLTKGLVACYPFFERGGTTLHDISGRNNQGTLININPATAWVRTPYGWGLDFDGVDDYINVPHHSSLEGATFSLSAYIKTSSTASKFIFFKMVNSPPYPGYAMCTNQASANQISMWVGGSAWTNASFTWDNNWHYVVGIYDGTAVKIYIDGNLLISQVQTHAQSTAPLRIGTADLPSYYLLGTIASTCIWNRGLTNNQIIQLCADPWAMYRPRSAYTMGSMPTIPTLRTLSLMGVGR